MVVEFGLNIKVITVPDHKGYTSVFRKRQPAVCDDFRTLYGKDDETPAPDQTLDGTSG